MSVLLPTRLPEGFTSEPATGAHASEVFDVCAAELVAAFGFCPDTEEDVRAELEPPQGSQATQHVVRDADGAVAQWWGVVRTPGDPIFWAWIRSHPGLAADAGDELARLAWPMMLDWIRQHAPDEERSGAHRVVGREQRDEDLIRARTALPARPQPRQQPGHVGAARPRRRRPPHHLHAASNAACVARQVVGGERRLLGPPPGLVVHGGRAYGAPSTRRR